LLFVLKIEPPAQIAREARLRGQTAESPIAL
jgi:hypothetical protein